MIKRVALGRFDVAFRLQHNGKVVRSLPAAGDETARAARVAGLCGKDFLEHAHTRWRAPAPRFVLLIGDASWDYKNTTVDDANYADWTYRPGEMSSFIKNSSTSYAEGAEIILKPRSGAGDEDPEA